MGTVDLMIAAPILAAAAWILYRSLRRTGGGCHGCPGGGCGARHAENGPEALVRLGRGARR